MLAQTGHRLNEEEARASQVLDAAAMTYVRALLTAIATLLYIVMRGAASN